MKVKKENMVKASNGLVLIWDSEIFCVFFVAKLVGGGFVINGAYLLLVFNRPGVAGAVL